MSQAQLAIHVPGVCHHHEYSLDSTQDQIDRYQAHCHGGQWVLLTADYQSAGRGTHGRHWHAQTGQNILMTLMTDTLQAGSVRYLTQVVGLSVVQVLQDHYDVAAQIKWVNDILIGGKKIAGILCEGDGRYCKIGLGFNVNMDEPSCAQVGQVATSLRLSTGVQQDRQRVLQHLVARIKANVELLQQRDFATCFLPAIQGAMAYLGQEVVFNTDGAERDQAKQITGVFAGLNDAGHIGIDGRYYASGRLLGLASKIP